MTNTKKLTLLLLPLVPLTAIGIVEVASAITVTDDTTVCALPVPPRVEPVQPPRVEPAPTPAPAPAPQPAPVA